MPRRTAFRVGDEVVYSYGRLHQLGRIQKILFGNQHQPSMFLFKPNDDKAFPVMGYELHKVVIR